MIRTTLLAAAAVASLAGAAHAQQNWTSQQIGPFGYHNSSDGWSGTTQQIGPFSYGNFTGPHGQSAHCTSQTIGSFTYTNCN